MPINTHKPVRLGESKKSDAKRIPVFSLNEVEYTIPELVSPSIFLKYMWDKRSGSEFAEMELLVAVLGEDAYKALMSYGDLSKEEWTAITEIIRDHAAGSMEDSGKD